MFSEEQKIYILLLIASGVLALILILFIISLIRNFKRFKKIQRELLSAEITASEKERRKIASDIHDDIAPLLAAAKMQISVVDEPEPALIKAMSNIDDAVSQVRMISHELMPAALDRKGLVPALKDHIHAYNANKNSVHINAQLQPISLRQNDVHLYRIIHELLHNAIKHSKGKLIEVKLYQKEEWIIAEVSDDGIGIQTTNNSGIGLLNIESRVQLLNASIVKETSSEKGTRFIIRIPVEKS